MYFESSSYVSGSLGQFFDDNGQKVSGDGTPLESICIRHTQHLLMLLLGLVML